MVKKINRAKVQNNYELANLLSVYYSTPIPPSRSNFVLLFCKLFGLIITEYSPLPLYLVSPKNILPSTSLGAKMN